MCLRFMNIKSTSLTGSHASFVPCGTCVECRNSMRTAWRIRLEAEPSNCRSLGWNIGFFTLTYNEKSLPIIPVDALKSDFEDKRIPCFSRSDVKTLILRLRKHLWKHYSIVGIKYMICCEYGEHTRRPHYHGVISWPPTLSSFDMHYLIRSFWVDNGYIFPQFYDGSGRHDTKPFLVEDSCKGIATYASKYCCKDIAFSDDTREFIVKNKVWNQHKQFHLQSKSFGLTFLKDMSDDKKRDILLNGISEVGSDHTCPVPLYFRRKILFNPYYIFDENGNRLVRQEASDFLRDNFREIFNQKVYFYADTFKTVSTDEFLDSHNVPESARELIKSCIVPFSVLATYYVAFFGVNNVDIIHSNPATFWLSRYEKDCSYIVSESNYFYGFEPEHLQALCFMFLSAFSYNSMDRLASKAYEKTLNYLMDFHNNNQGG